MLVCPAGAFWGASQSAVISDLHTHPTASGGRLTPQELVHRAHE
ncbi:hypothetical protein Q8G24_27485, partial [Klebsiella pneumoniae]|nr:hypothetical protein [Klebsiella pneumoniae]